MNLKGTTKIVFIVLLLAVATGLVPLLAWPLPYEGLNWAELGFQLYYEPQTVGLELTKTVGRDPNQCARSNQIYAVDGARVVYCYQIVNTGTETLRWHNLRDNELGRLLNMASRRVEPGQTFWVTATTSLEISTLNRAIWEASPDGSQQTAVDRAFAGVIVGRPEQIVEQISNEGGEIVFSPQYNFGWRTVIDVPPGAIGEQGATPAIHRTATFTFTARLAPPHQVPLQYQVAGYGFNLVAQLATPYPNNLFLPSVLREYGPNVSLPLGSGPEQGGLVFAEPIVISIFYEEDELPFGIAEEQLALYFWNGSQWVNGAANCGPNGPGHEYDYANNILRLSVCHLTEWALLGE